MFLCIASLLTFRSEYMKLFAFSWVWASPSSCALPACSHSGQNIWSSLPSPGSEPAQAPVHCQLAYIQVRIHEALCLLLGLSQPMLLFIASFLTFKSEYMKIFASSWGWASLCSCALPACSHSGQNIWSSLPPPEAEPAHAPVYCQLAHIQVRIYEALCLLLRLSQPMLLFIASFLTFKSEYMKIFASSWGWATHAPVHCQLAHIQVRIYEALCLLLRLSQPMLLYIASLLTFRSEYIKFFTSSWGWASPCSCTLPACSLSGQKTYMKIFASSWGWASPCSCVLPACSHSVQNTWNSLPPPRTEPTNAPVHCQLVHIQVRKHEALCLLIGLSQPMVLCIASLLTFRSEYVKIFASSWGWASICSCILPACSHSGQDTWRSLPPPEAEPAHAPVYCQYAHIQVRMLYMWGWGGGGGEYFFLLIVHGGNWFMKKARSRKSLDTVPLM